VIKAYLEFETVMLAVDRKAHSLGRRAARNHVSLKTQLEINPDINQVYPRFALIEFHIFI